MGKILGIDLGTTNSAMAIVEAGEPRIIENKEGSRTTPSMVAIGKNGERLVGILAKRQAITNPKNTIFGIKRYIGHKFKDPEVQRDLQTVPYTLKEGPNGEVLVELGGKDYRPEEISAMILQKLKQDAEEKLGEEIKEAVITVPAYFNDAQRQATKDAGRIAGLEVKRIINEPTAAALAYGFDKKKDEKIAVFDFGGGTFDISILEVGDDVIEVKSTDGDSHMGGRDIDQKIVKWLIDEFKKEHGIDLSNDPLALQRLDEAAEKAKIELSSTTETEINIPFITSDESGPKHLLITLTRAKLNELASEFVDKALEITKRAVEASPFSVDEIDEVILVGGQTRMPLIVEKVKEFFGKEPNKSINPDEVVALGAAIQGGILSGEVKDVLLLDVIPISLGIETLGGITAKLIEKNTPIPTKKSQIFSTATDNQTQVEIHVVQGEREMAQDNKSLGRFILDGIPPAPRGVPQIEVTFEIDANGILTVTAKDKQTGKSQSIKIEGSSNLSEEEIERMKKEAEEHAEEDRRKKELAEARNKAEQLIYETEKYMKDLKDENLKKKAQQQIDELKAVTEKEDKQQIEEKSNQLAQTLAQIMQQTQSNTSAGAQEANSASENSQQDSSEQAKEAKFESKGNEEDKKEDKKEDENK